MTGFSAFRTGLLASATLLSGCASMGPDGGMWSNCKTGAILGGFAGGVAGSQAAGGNSGETIVGAAAGAFALGAVGCAIERAIDADQAKDAGPAADAYTDEDGVMRIGSETANAMELAEVDAKAALDATEPSVDATAETEIAVSVTDANLIASVQFEFNSIELTGEAHRLITKIAANIAAENASLTLVIGHASKEGNDLYNLDLSIRRARAVRGALAAVGLPANRIRIEGVGSSHPLSGVDEFDPRNRRVEIFKSGD